MPFTEGKEVKAGHVLFVIDARPYQAQLDQAVAQVTSNEESYKLAKSIYTRDLSAPNAVSSQELEQDHATMQEAEAKVKAAKASTEVYKLNIEYSKVVVADHRAGQPLLRHERQPDRPGFDAADYHRFARSHLRLL